MAKRFVYVCAGLFLLLALFAGNAQAGAIGASPLFRSVLAADPLPVATAAPPETVYIERAVAPSTAGVELSTPKKEPEGAQVAIGLITSLVGVYFLIDGINGKSTPVTILGATFHVEEDETAKIVGGAIGAIGGIIIAVVP